MLLNSSHLACILHNLTFAQQLYKLMNINNTWAFVHKDRVQKALSWAEKHVCIYVICIIKQRTLAIPNKAKHNFINGSWSRFRQNGAIDFTFYKEINLCLLWSENIKHFGAKMHKLCFTENDVKLFHPLLLKQLWVKWCSNKCWIKHKKKSWRCAKPCPVLTHVLIKVVRMLQDLAES